MRTLDVMRLYHSTDESCKQGIERDGFRSSKVVDSIGSVWFCDGKDPDVPTTRREWWVSIDLSDEIAAPYLYRFPDGQAYGTDLFGNYLVPVGVANSERPFLFERWA